MSVIKLNRVHGLDWRRILLSVALGLAVALVFSSTAMAPESVGFRIGPLTLPQTKSQLEIAKLREEVSLLRRGSQRDFQLWIGQNLTGLITSVGTIAVGGWAVIKYLRDKQDEIKIRDEREKDRLEDQKAGRTQVAEERFHKVVEGLGETAPSARIGAAVTLRMFLQRGDDEFYTPVFDLASVHLRLLPVDPENALLREALANVFRESFAQARSEPAVDPADLTVNIREIQEQRAIFARLDGSRIIMIGTDHTGADFRFAHLTDADFSDSNLDGADFSGSDVILAQFGNASLQGAKFIRANAGGALFNDARLELSDLSEATLSDSSFVNAGLAGARLRRTNFATLATPPGSRLGRRSDLSGVNLHAADAISADFSRTNLTKAILSAADFSNANFSWADLSGADCTDATFSGADLSHTNLSQTNLEHARALDGVTLLNTRGLTSWQRNTCRAKGAIV